MPYVWLVQWASGVAGECPLTLLRTFNAVLLVASFVLAYLLAMYAPRYPPGCQRAMMERGY